jgi:hypothetical protein
MIGKFGFVLFAVLSLLAQPKGSGQAPQRRPAGLCGARPLAAGLKFSDRLARSCSSLGSWVC